MSAMMTGVNTNQSVIGFGRGHRADDFNNDGDGPASWTMLEMAQGARHEGWRGLHRADHARHAGRHLFTHQSAQQRKRHRAPGAADRRHLQSSARRRHRRPDGWRSTLLRSLDRHRRRRWIRRRTDNRDLRKEFVAAGYKYVWNRTGFNALSADSRSCPGSLRARPHGV